MAKKQKAILGHKNSINSQVQTFIPELRRQSWADLMSLRATWSTELVLGQPWLHRKTRSRKGGGGGGGEGRSLEAQKCGCQETIVILFIVRVLCNPGWLQDPYVRRDNLELQISCLHLLSSGMVGYHHHTQLNVLSGIEARASGVLNEHS